MQFINHTPFPAIAFDALDQREHRFHTVVMRLTFEVQADGTLAFASAQTPLAATDEYYGEPNQSSVKQESDFVPYKPHTDVIVIANAYAPQHRAKSRFTVGISVTSVSAPQQLPSEPYGLNPFQAPSHQQIIAWRQECARIQSAAHKVDVVFNKRLIVTGPREWRKRYLLTRALSLFTLPKWKLTSPAPITELPLRYEYAYGGDNKILVTERSAKRVKKKDRLPGRVPQSTNANVHADSKQETSTIAHSVYHENTVGRGFAERWYLNASKAGRIPAPQIEAPDERITRFGKATTPRGMGVITRAWQPRLPLAGTYNQQWLEQRHPYLPFDFNFAYWNGAPRDQQVTPHLDGNETITLTNLCPLGTPGASSDATGNTQLRFTLPGHLPFALVRFEEGQLGELAAKLDTLIIDTTPDADDPDKKPTIVCVWRATVASEPEVRVLEARMIAKRDVEMMREQEKAKESMQPNNSASAPYQEAASPHRSSTSA